MTFIQTNISQFSIDIKIGYRFDIGEIVTQERTEIHLHETLPELYSKLAKQGGNLIVHAIRKLPEILTHATPQDPTEVTYGKNFGSKYISIVSIIQHFFCVLY